MKTLYASLATVLLASSLIIGCKKDSTANAVTDQTNELVGGNKPVANPENCTGYLVSLNVDKSTTPGHTIFTWTITNPNPGNGSGSTLQNLSHWDFIPGTCLDDNWQDVLSVSYNSGSGWNSIPFNYQTDIQPDASLKNSGYTDDVFKFAYGTSGATPTQYRIELLGNWGTADLNVYFKSGANTGYCQKTFTNLGIGCPEEEVCSWSQGYWFANHADPQTSLTVYNHPWPANVVIAANTYSNAEGIAIWNASNKGGIKDAKKSFTQLSSIYLSLGVDPIPSEISAYVTTIESWFASYGGKVTAANLQPDVRRDRSLRKCTRRCRPTEPLDRHAPLPIKFDLFSYQCHPSGWHWYLHDELTARR